MSRTPPASGSHLEDLPRYLRKSSLTLAFECARWRFEESPDLLARMASHGTMDYSEVVVLARDLVEGRLTPQQARATLDPFALSSLARLMTALRTPLQDFDEPALLTRAVRRIQGAVHLGREAPLLEVQTNLAVSEFGHVEWLLRRDLVRGGIRWVAEVELNHPDRGRPGSTEERWLRVFNRRFREDGLLPVRLTDEPAPRFDRLTADVPPRLVVEDGPLVTIIMSTFKPDASFRTAVQSLVDQTWRNLEILVLDDCSPPEHSELLESVTSMDPRIRLIRMPENGGTYRIRNHAIAESRGDIITFQDSDDWAHPERIARQVAPLLAPAGVVATRCTTVRVNGDLSTYKVGFSPFRPGAASLMFRKDLALPALGGYDPVRKAADTEFTERLAAFFGRDALVELPDVLVATQLTEGSLSRAEFAFGWHHGSRRAYLDAYKPWHRAIAEHRVSAYLDPGGPRKFPAPDRFVTGRESAPRICDVLFVSDWRRGMTRYDDVTAQVAAVARAGMTTAVSQAVALRHAEGHRLPMRDEAMALQAEGRTRFAIWGEPLHARLMVVTDPELLSLTRPPGDVALSADRVVVVAGHSPVAPRNPWLTYDPAAVERNATRMFGTAPEWLPAHADIAEALTKHGAQQAVLSPRHLRVADEVRRRPYTGARSTSRLVIGTTGLEHARRDRPTWTALRRLLPRDQAYDVRLRTSERVLDAVLGGHRVPSGWLVLDESVPLRGFMRQLDVFVPVPSRSWGPELPATVLTALAEGAVVVADPAYEPHLGGAAIYAAAVDVHDELKALAADPARLTEYRERGYAFCRDVVSASATADLVRELAGL